MRKLLPVFLLVIVLGSVHALAACEQATLQTAMQTTHEHPFVHMKAQRSVSAPVLIAWIAALSAAAVAIRALRRYSTPSLNGTRGSKSMGMSFCASSAARRSSGILS